MKKINQLISIFFLCGFFMLSSCHKTSYTGLTNQDFTHHSNTIKKYALRVDSRSKEDFEKGHLKNAVNIPFSENFLTDLENHLKSKGVSKKIVLFIYASSKDITLNQINEIKQKLKEQESLKIYAVNYLSEDYATSEMRTK